MSATLAPVPPSDAPILRTPPHNYEAEQALLGAVLMNNRALDRVSEFLKPNHFADPVHGRIYDACIALAGRNQLANPVTLKSYLATDEGLKELGGDAYLAHLAAAAATIINAEDYGRLIFDLHLRRELIGIGEDMVNDSFEQGIEGMATELIEDAEKKLFDLATDGQAEGGLKPFRAAMITAIDMAEAAQKRDGGLSGVTTGLRDLDRLLGGLHPSDLIILAGRPSMGKTALATSIAYSAAKALRIETLPTGEKRAVEGGLCAFFSLEMSSEQLATRILAERSEISSHDIRQGKLSEEQFERLVVAAQELHSLPLYIDDTPALSISAVRTRARRQARREGLGLIVVDYLQLLQGSS
ncbi:MAG: DnaB-like helicase C-terminal domain-containing protein, partial [Rhodospirillaceae bacterium]|nr:DnaB-like helicase C-terminal domain-containing protein [Rhodospirillaceae bacterium]